jgi:hypothetical protein
VSQKEELKQESPTYNYLVASGEKPFASTASMKIKAARN